MGKNSNMNRIGNVRDQAIRELRSTTRVEDEQPSDVNCTTSKLNYLSRRPPSGKHLEWMDDTRFNWKIVWLNWEFIHSEFTGN